MQEPASQAEVATVAHALRKATRSAHRRLDHHPLLQRLIRPGLTWDAYARSLRALYLPQARLEACVVSGAARLGLDAQEDAPSPSRLERLAADLTVLGLAVPTADGRDLPIAASPAVLAGQRYVLEGARLGGQVIARNVVTELGTSAPLAYFTAPGAAYHWQRLLTYLDRHCPASEVGAAVTAARLAFEDFRVSLGAGSGDRT